MVLLQRQLNVFSVVCLLQVTFTVEHKNSFCIHVYVCTYKPHANVKWKNFPHTQWWLAKLLAGFLVKLFIFVYLYCLINFWARANMFRCVYLFFLFSNCSCCYCCSYMLFNTTTRSIRKHICTYIHAYARIVFTSLKIKLIFYFNFCCSFINLFLVSFHLF